MVVDKNFVSASCCRVPHLKFDCKILVKIKEYHRCAVLRISGDTDIRKKDDLYEQLHGVQEKPPVDGIVTGDPNIKVDCNAHWPSIRWEDIVLVTVTTTVNGVVWIDREKFAAT